MSVEKGIKVEFENWASGPESPVYRHAVVIGGIAPTGTYVVIRTDVFEKFRNDPVFIQLLTQVRDALDVKIKESTQ
jgi:hypothetical protein